MPSGLLIPRINVTDPTSQAPKRYAAPPDYRHARGTALLTTPRRPHGRSADGPQFAPLGGCWRVAICAGQTKFTHRFPLGPTTRNARCEVALHPLSQPMP